MKSPKNGRREVGNIRYVYQQKVEVQLIQLVTDTINQDSRYAVNGRQVQLVLN